MKKIAVANCKGGTGKTTVLYNLAGELAKKKKVLLIDCDPQANLSLACGIDTTNQEIMCVRTIFENPKVKPEDIVINGFFEELPNLSIIPSVLKLMITIEKVLTLPAKEQLLNYYIEDNMDYFSQFDYIFFDTNPGMNIVDTNAYYTADDILLITIPTEFGIEGVQAFDFVWESRREWLRKEDNIGAVIVNNFTKTSSEPKESLEKMREDIGDIVCKNVIYGATDMERTVKYHAPIAFYDPKHRNNEQICEIIKELKKKGVL